MLVANDPNPERAMRLRANLLRCGVQSVMVSELPGEDFSECLAFFMQFWWMLHAQLKQMFAEIVECWTDGGFRSSPKPT